MSDDKSITVNEQHGSFFRTKFRHNILD